MQISFDSLKEPYKITKPIRLIELFGGVGSQAMAIKRLGVGYEHYRLCEFDRFAVASYNAIHGTDFKPSNIKNWSGADLGIEETDHCYFLTYSFPCQDLSPAGKRKGMKKGEGTRSGLLWEVERLLNETERLPDVLLMENVPQVHNNENFQAFRKWELFLETKGYKNYWQDINARHYGVPQNRNRCFMVSVLGDYGYTFPEAIPLEKCLADLLEADVPEKYFLSDEQTKTLLDRAFIGKTDDCNKLIEVCNLYESGIQGYNRMSGSVVSPEGISGAVRANSGGCSEIKITASVLTQKRTEYGKACPGRKAYEAGDLDEKRKNIQQLEPRNDGVSNTLTTVQKDNLLMVAGVTLGQSDSFAAPPIDGMSRALRVKADSGVMIDTRIRKLTALETWRLMDFTDSDFEKAKWYSQQEISAMFSELEAKGVKYKNKKPYRQFTETGRIERMSNSKMYKQAGNSIVVAGLERIIERLCKP